MIYILTPAYGRDYKSKSAVLEAWTSEQVFVIQNVDSPWCGRPVNRSQIADETVNIRYNQNRKIAVNVNGV